MYVIGWTKCFNIGKYMFSEKIFIKKAIFVLVINESREKMLENNNRKIATFWEIILTQFKVFVTFVNLFKL